jgi:EAL domain-containing protein (putative c-di-GMP-specific phosphodiesterase class I)
VSAGLAPIHSQSGSLSDVLAAADSACYVAKEQGRNRVHTYQPDDAEVAHRHGQMQWVPRIKHALDENRFRLYCEELIAITPAASHRRQFEILLRMIDEDGNEIAPMTFIPAAERYHLMPSVDRWVIAQTFEALTQNIQTRGLQHETDDAIFAINLSGQSIGDEQFLAYILALFDKTAISPNRICFEITETAAIANLAKAIRFITVLKNMGCYFALDDFGSGLSSFAYLRNLPVDYLKMDASFFHNSLNDQINYAMVDAINEIGHLMGLLTIAEGVQSDLGLERIKCIGIDYGQGHHISQATPLRELLANGPTSLRRELVSATG